MKKQLFFSFLFLTSNLITSTYLIAAAEPQKSTYLSIKPVRPLTSCRTSQNLQLLEDPTEVSFKVTIGNLAKNEAYNSATKNLTTISSYINDSKSNPADINLKTAVRDAHHKVHLHPKIRSIITVKDNASRFKTSSALDEKWPFQESMSLNVVLTKKNISDKYWDAVCDIVKDIPTAVYTNDKPAKTTYLTLLTMLKLKKNKNIGMQATLEI